MSASADGELIAVTSQITKQALCAREFSAGVCIPVTARFLTLSPLSSLLPPPPPSPACSLSSIKNDGVTPLSYSPVTLHVYPNIHRVCQTGRVPRCPSLCPSLSTDTHAFTHMYAHTSDVPK